MSDVSLLQSNFTYSSSMKRAASPPTTPSSEEPEENTEHLENSLEKILALRPISWRWKDARADQTIQYGFIAQEVEEVLPELVSEQRWIDGSTRKFLTTAHMTPYLIEALKEQDRYIDDTVQQIAELVAKLQEMQQQIAELQEKLKQPQGGNK